MLELILLFIVLKFMFSLIKTAIRLALVFSPIGLIYYLIRRGSRRRYIRRFN